MRLGENLEPVLDLSRATRSEGKCSYCGRTLVLHVFADRHGNGAVALCDGCIERLAIFKKTVSVGFSRE